MVRSAAKEASEQLVVQAREADDGASQIANTETLGASTDQAAAGQQLPAGVEGQPIRTLAVSKEYQIAEKTTDTTVAVLSNPSNTKVKSSDSTDPPMFGATTTKVAYLSQAERLQVQPINSQSPGDSRVNLTSTAGPTASDAVSTPMTSLSSAEDQKTQYLTASTTSSLTQTTVPEKSFQSLGAMNERSDVLPASTTSVTSSASSRVESPMLTTPPTPVDSKQIAQQINQAIIRMDGARTEVMLDPVELGRVSLTFITKDEGVTVLINADRSETADLLRRNGEQLQRDLSESGYAGVELEFDQSDDPHRDQSKPDGFNEAASTQSLSFSYDANSITSGLDIRI